ncbi:hypothetical protein ACHAWF_018894 [Thalassiosira exigua]
MGLLIPKYTNNLLILCGGTPQAGDKLFSRFIARGWDRVTIKGHTLFADNKLRHSPLTAVTPEPICNKIGSLFIWNTTPMIFIARKFASCASSIASKLSRPSWKSSKLPLHTPSTTTHKKR